MSAESPRKAGGRGAHTVAPLPVSDRSIIESVAGFINEVVPQAYTSLPSGEGKEAITWARFEYGDINDPALYPDTADDRSSTPPLLLVLGYCTGVQVWAIPANGEATEVLSWRQGVVRTLRVLPTPLADSPIPDAFGHKRPLVALCDSAGPGPQFCSLSFISLRGGDQVKSIKFKNPVSDVLANRRSVVVTFPERIAVFDACTLEDRLTVTTCYPCPGPNPNPVALGTRWLAYAERQFLHAYRSSGGTEGEGVQSYTATVLHAAKSLGKGLRELGETVASSLTGGAGGTSMQRAPMGVVGLPGAIPMSTGCDAGHPGVVTILDAQGVSTSRGDDLRSGDTSSSVSNADLIVAHFAAHSEPIVAVQFDPSGMLLLTADKRGHDFHVFRIQPHPGGSSLAAVHHLYVLHRGDTTAKVQDIAFAADSRWVAVSTMRGTTHVFPITPYGGPVGIRTHTTPHVVNRLSRFHRSAGLTADGRNSPVPVPVPNVCTTATGSYESTALSPAMPYPNARLPPYPHPTNINPLAQIRQPITHTLLPGMPPMSPVFSQQAYRNPSARVIGRSQSVSDENVSGSGVLLRVSACFAAPRAWLVGSPTVPRESSSRAHKRSVDSLFVMACHGSLIEYELEPKHASGIPKEKICDDTAIELEVKAKAQWLLLRPPHSSELQPPLPASNPLMVLPDHLPPASESRPDDADERWLSQVEIVTHAGPHRRLWMGPQFTFKTYTNTTPGAPLSLLEMEAVEVGTGSGSRPARSNPVNMPLTGRPVVPVLIESGSSSSYEQSPRLMETYGDGDSDGSAGPGDTQLREDLADAMMESPGIPIRDTGRRTVIAMPSKRSTFPIEKVVNPVGTVITVAVASDEETGGPPSPAASFRGGERVLPAGAGTVDADVVRWPTVIKHSMTQVVDTDGNRSASSTSNSAFRQTSFSRVNDEGRTQWPKGAASFTQNVEASVNVSPHVISRDLCRRNDPRYRKGDVRSSLDSVPDVVALNSISKEVLNKSENTGSSISPTAKDFQKGWRIKNIGVDSDSVQETISSKCEAELSGILANIPSLSHIDQTGSSLERFSEVSSGGISVARRGRIESTRTKCDKVGEIETEIITIKKDDKTIPKKSKRSTGRQKDKDDTEHEYEMFQSQCHVAREKLDVIEKGPSDKIHRKPGKFSSSFKLESKQPNEGGCQLLQGTQCNLQTDADTHSDIIKQVEKQCQNMDKEIEEKYSSRRKLKQEAVSDCESASQRSVSNIFPAYRNDDTDVQKLFIENGVEVSKSKSKSQKTYSNIKSYKSEDYQGVTAESQKGERELENSEKQANMEKFPHPKITEEKKKLDKHCSQFLVKEELQKPAFSSVEAPTLKSWSSVVSSSPKEKTEQKKDKDINVEKHKTWSDIASVGLDPDILSAACSSVEQGTEAECPVLESVMKEDARNNNQSKEELFVEALEEPVTAPHHCSWGNIVSSPKAGTSSSTDEGSGEYDSNDSKESINLGLDELEERPSSKSASSEMVTASESLSASSLATPLDEDSSGTLIKILNDDDVSSDMAAVSSLASSKKNRRAKKKRR